MNEGSSSPDSAAPGGAGGEEATRTFLPHDPVTRPRMTEPGNQAALASTETVAPRPPAGFPAHPPTEVVRYGPGVPAALPAGGAELTAERVWRTRGPAESRRRRARMRRLLGSALTVILLAASGAVLYLRFHHAPFHVTGVAISEQASTGCGADVTGRITTDGSAGTVSYQWLFQPGAQPPRPLSQSVLAGRQAVYVTVAVEGTGKGSASQTVTLQILGPDPMAASIPVVVTCQ